MNKVKIGNRELTKEETEQLYYCILVRLGFIETGTINRAKDIEKMKDQRHKIKVLGKDQMKLIIMLEEIMEELFNHGN